MDTAEILDHMYEGFGPEPEGEDFAFGLEQDQIDIAFSQAQFWGEVNEARKQVGIVAWEGLVTEGYFKARAQTDPNLLTDALLELAAVLVAFGESVQRQTYAVEALGAVLTDEEPDEEEE